MYNNWTKDLSDSSRAIWSIKDSVLPKLINGRIHSIEESNNDTLLLFDKHSGVDLIRQDKIGLQGIASRVQFGNDWQTYTIRAKRQSGAKTELEKRLEQIQHGYFYPAFTLQAYFDNRKDLNLLSIAVVKTVDLYHFLINNPSRVKKRTSDNMFIFCSWYDLKASGYKIKIINNKHL